MRIQIQGRVYEADTLTKPKLSDLIALYRETGLEPEYILESISEIEAGHMGGRGLIAMAAIVWLARRAAGEHLTFEQAVEFDLSEIKLFPDPVPVVDEAPAAPDPQSPPLAQQVSPAADERSDTEASEPAHSPSAGPSSSPASTDA